MDRTRLSRKRVVIAEPFAEHGLAVLRGAGIEVDSQVGRSRADLVAALAGADGLIVLNTPGANTLAATEQTFALMLSLSRRTPLAVQQLREGIWDRKQLIGTELFGKTLGIVGLGRIGGNVATRARAFAMTILAHDPYVTAARADAFDAKLVDLATLLRASDIVTLHVPLTPQTLGMIDAAKLRLMQPHAYLVNCARGGVIVEQDLLAALDAGVLAGAA